MTTTPEGVSLGMPQLPAPDYPDDVQTPARGGRARDRRPLPGLPFGAPSVAASRAVGGGPCHAHGAAVLRGRTEPDHGRGHRRRDLLLDVPAQADDEACQVGVCTNTLCAVMGGDAIFEALQDHLGVGNGETTDDGKVTLEHIECNAACDFAPVVMVNWEFFDDPTVGLREAPREGRPSAREQRSHPPAAPPCAPSRTPRGSWRASRRREGAVEAGGSAGPAWLTMRLRLAKGESVQARVVHPRGGRAPQDQPPAEHLSSHETRTGARGPFTDPSHPAGPAAEEGEWMTLAPEIDETSPEKLLAPVLSAFWDEEKSWSLDVPGGTRGTRGCARRWPCRRTT